MSLKDAERAPRCLFGRPHKYLSEFDPDEPGTFYKCAMCGRVEDLNGDVVPPWDGTIFGVKVTTATTPPR